MPRITTSTSIVTDSRATARGQRITAEIGSTIVQFERLLMPAGGILALAPAIVVDPGAGIRIDIDQWQPTNLGDVQVSALPVTLPLPAAQACLRAFEADPAVDWDSHPEQISAWCQRSLGQQR